MEGWGGGGGGGGTNDWSHGGQGSTLCGVGLVNGDHTGRVPSLSVGQAGIPRYTCLYYKIRAFGFRSDVLCHTYTPYDLHLIFCITHIHPMIYADILGRICTPYEEHQAKVWVCRRNRFQKKNNSSTKATAGGTSKAWSDAAMVGGYLLPFGVLCHVLYYIHICI